MNFLKKNYKLIIGIVIGAILISGISVYATGQYLASQVTYNNTNVASALDDLYSRQSTTISNLNNQISELQNTELSLGTAQYYEHLLTPSTEYDNINFELPKGKYLVIITLTTSGDWNGQRSFIDDWDITNTLSSKNSNCTIRKISRRSYAKSGTTAYTNSVHVLTYVETELFYVNVKNNSSTITSSMTFGFTYAQMGSVHAIQAIPIN